MDWLTVVMVQFKGAWRVLPSELPAKELMASDVWPAASAQRLFCSVRNVREHTICLRARRIT